MGRCPQPSDGRGKTPQLNAKNSFEFIRLGRDLLASGVVYPPWVDLSNWNTEISCY